MVDSSNQTISNQENSAYQYDWQNPNLRKFDFGRVMGRTFQGALHCAKSFWVPLFLIFGLPMFLISLWPMLLPAGAYGDLLSGGGFEGFEDLFSPVLVTSVCVIYLLYLFIYAILYIAISHNIFGFYNGNVPSFKQSIKRATSRLWVAIGATILFGLGVMFGLLLFIIPGILLMLGWYIVAPVVAVEDKGPLESLSRSWEMSKGSKRWILLFFVVLVVISAVSQAIFSLIALPFGNQTTALLEGGTTTFWVLNAIAATMAQFIVLLLTVAGITSVYYEIRDVKEGAVQESLSAVFD